MLIQTYITDYYFPIGTNKKIINGKFAKKNQTQSKLTQYYEKKRKLPELTKSNEQTEIDTNKKTKIHGYNFQTESWHCLECGEDMGPNNPRQLCGKYFCKNIL